MRTSVQGLVAWRHDLATCLHSCMAALLEFHGVDALQVLGANWSFYHRPDGLARAEYYFPCRPGISLMESLAPHHPVRSTWHEPADADEGWREVREVVATGQPVAVAVDNYELPFRPAYHDVHSNHLLIVHGFDEERGTVEVIDAIPPRFAGEIRIDQLRASRDSANEARHDRDIFFAAQPIGNRWLDVSVDTCGFPAFDREFVRAVIRRNLQTLAAAEAAATDEEFSGLDGERRYFRGMIDRYSRGEPIWEELFVVAGAALSVIAVHADWLAEAGRRFELPDLRYAGRLADRIAHHWTALRILAARTRDGATTTAQLNRRTSDLLLGQEKLRDDLLHAATAL